MEKDKSLVNNAMFYGLIFGIILVVYTFFAQQSMLNEGVGMMRGIVQGGISLLLYFLGVVISTIHFRKSKLDNFMTYRQSFLFGVLVLFFSSFIVAVYTFVYAQWINPEYTAQLYEMTVQLTLDMYERMNVSEDIIEKAMVQLEAKGISTPTEMAMSSVWGGIIMGVIVSLITSIFTQRRNSDPFAGIETDSADNTASN